ncbi:hypothetical protein Tsubulata_046852, partial [Turnera subulata]
KIWQVSSKHRTLTEEVGLWWCTYKHYKPLCYFHILLNFPSRKQRHHKPKRQPFILE